MPLPHDLPPDPPHNFPPDPPGPQDALALLHRESRSFVQRLRLWTPARWAAAAAPYGTRGDLVHHLAQVLAGLVADLEGGAQRRLPRLDSDLGLPDQLAVTADDLVRAQPAAEVARDATAHLLAHRADLLGEAVPPGLAAGLGLDDPVAHGHLACAATIRRRER
ncbi:MAG: hypothetical protein WD794_13535 [Mycobacteriales bacterium]